YDGQPRYLHSFPTRRSSDLLARQLAKLIFDKEVRVYGTTTWSRDSKGQWTCETMLVENFDIPDATGLQQLFDDLRSIPGNEWHRSEEHTSELQSQSNLVCRL